MTQGAWFWVRLWYSICIAPLTEGCHKYALRNNIREIPALSSQIAHQVKKTISLVGRIPQTVMRRNSPMGRNLGGNPSIVGEPILLQPMGYQINRFSWKWGGLLLSEPGFSSSAAFCHRGSSQDGPHYDQRSSEREKERERGRERERQRDWACVFLFLLISPALWLIYLYPSVRMFLWH